MSKEFGVPFGSTSRGEEVRELTLSNGVLTARVITFGGVLLAVRLPTSGPPGSHGVTGVCTRPGNVFTAAC